MMDSLERREVYFAGMVQGVGFRYTTRRIAERFRVTGFVQNLPDGRVRTVVEGTALEIDRFLDAIGSELGHYITTQEQDRSEPVGGLQSFDIRF